MTYTVQTDYGYGHGWEDTVTEDTPEAGRTQLETYRTNQPQYRHRLVPDRDDQPEED